MIIFKDLVALELRLALGVLERRAGIGFPGTRLPGSVEADRYVASVVRKFAVGARGLAVRAAEELAPLIGEWAGKRLWGVELSGSYAKGTATSLGTDVDLFISLAPDGTPVKESFWSLVEFCAARGSRPQVRDVSIRVMSGEYKVDLVPGRVVGESVASSRLPVASKSSAGRAVSAQLSAVREGRAVDGRDQSGDADENRFLASLGMTKLGGTSAPQAKGAPHTLYRRRSDRWIKTDVRKHVEAVQAAGCAEEIRALKIWRERWSLEWPSFYLELCVIRALGAGDGPRSWQNGRRSSVFGRRQNLGGGQGIAARARAILEFVAEGGLEMRVVDPANSNNVVSDELGFEEKRALVVAARKSLGKESWEQVVW